jgi:hypothetical protein
MNLTEWATCPTTHHTLPLRELLTEALHGETMAYSLLKIWKEGAAADEDKLIQIVEMLGLPSSGPRTKNEYDLFIRGMEVFMSGMAYLLCQIRELDGTIEEKE